MNYKHIFRKFLLDANFVFQHILPNQMKLSSPPNKIAI